MRRSSWNGVHALHFNDLLPAADRIAVDSLRITPTIIEVKLRCTARSACCPICQTACHRVHSRYVRVIRDLPWGGTPMVLRFSTRRFFCDNTECRRRIFAEELPDLAHRRARGTPRLDQTLVKIGLECGGEPGQRLCGELGIPTSGDTLLRRLRAAAPAEGHAGNVIGIDDFAFRRGQRYGTIVVDHESGGVIDLLADRTSATLEAWLSARPAAPTIVTRDRSGVYAKAITAATSDAIQVADRWHLLAMVRRCVAPWRTPTERLRLCGSKPRPRSPVPLKLQRPSSDRLSWLLIKDDVKRRTGESELLEELRKNCEPIRLACSFGEAIRNRDLNALTAWTERALQTPSVKEMKGFADGVIRNWPEVKAAVELPWSNGRTEGHVNRLKLIKRKMYGRAKLDLLRIRVVGSGP
jgi:transposase